MITPSTVREQLGDQLDAALTDFGGLGDVRACAIKPVADAVQRLIVTDRRSIPRLMLHCSRKDNGDLVQRAIERGRAARDCLGEDIGVPVLLPTIEHQTEKLSLAAYAFCPRLQDRRLPWVFQRLTVVPRIYGWLREVVAKSLDTPTELELRSLFIDPLERMADDTRFSLRIRETASRGLARLANGRWTPRVALSHNDFWKRNVLLPAEHARRGNRFGIVVIDWPGSSDRGHPFYDLLRMSLSTRAAWSSLTPELDEHCRIVGCGQQDVPTYIASHIGWLGQHLNHFPEHRFVEISESCFDELLPAVTLPATPPVSPTRAPVASAAKVAS